MKRVLLIKLTSMGDLMHALPAITEAKSKYEDIEFDWVIDKNFSSVAKWHPSVINTIETNHRKWKTNIFSSEVRKEIKDIRSKINEASYDFVVDMQNNLKSAFVSYNSKQEVYGMDKNSAREFPAHLAYKNKIEVDKSLHAVLRQKILLSSSLGYETNLEINDYGIEKIAFKKPDFDLPDNYCVLVQNASWPTKLWSVQKWQDLIDYLEQKNITCLLPSGTIKEKLRAETIASKSNLAKALDVMDLNKVAYLIDNANFCVCSDTGLAHLSAVVGTPSTTLYGPTDVNLIGTFGKNQAHLIGDNGDMEAISVERVISSLRI